MKGQLMILLTAIPPLVIKGTSVAPFKFISEHLSLQGQSLKEVSHIPDYTNKNNIKTGLNINKFTYEALCKKVERTLGEESSCTGTFIKGERMYYCFKTLKKPHVQLLIREDGKLFDAYTYHAEGELQLI